MGVEQVGDAVQRDGGLPRPRSALDHDDAGERQPDDRVLFGLDRRHDVAHRRPARRLERGQQRRVGRGSGIGVAVEHVVVEIRDPLVGCHSGDLEMSPPGQAKRRRQRGAVERPAGGRPPVDERALPVGGVGEPDAADVARRPVGVVEPAEAQPRAGGGQRAHPLRPAVHGDVALPAGAELPARLRGQRARAWAVAAASSVASRACSRRIPGGLHRQLLLDRGTVDARPARANMKLRSDEFLF